MRGLVSELETCDPGLAPVLNKHALFKPFSKEETIPSPIGGQPSADWALGFESISHQPTPEFLALWKKHAEEE